MNTINKASQINKVDGTNGTTRKKQRTTTN